jgi:hypothetical protein
VDESHQVAVRLPEEEKYSRVVGRTIGTEKAPQCLEVLLDTPHGGAIRLLYLDHDRVVQTLAGHVPHKVRLQRTTVADHVQTSLVDFGGQPVVGRGDIPYGPSRSVQKQSQLVVELVGVDTLPVLAVADVVLSRDHGHFEPLWADVRTGSPQGVHEGCSREGRIERHAPS